MRLALLPIVAAIISCATSTGAGPGARPTAGATSPSTAAAPADAARIQALLDAAEAASEKDDQTAAAKGYFDAASAAHALGDRHLQALSLRGLAYLNWEDGADAAAVDYLWRGAQLVSDGTTSNEDVSDEYAAAGEALLMSHQWEGALSALSISLQALEAVRGTLTGAARRDLKDRNILAYRRELLAIGNQPTPDGALMFKMLEAMHARFLVDELGGGSINSIELAALENSIPADAVVVEFFQLARNEFLEMSFTHDGFLCGSFSADGIAKDIEPSATTGTAAGSRGFRNTSRDKRLARLSGPLDVAVAKFRALLQDPDPNDGGKAVRALGHRFYDAIFSPFTSLMAGKTTLWIVPDGVLGTLPFEALVDDSGHYLAESMTAVQYFPSLTALGLLARNYEADRKPLLVLGGADYHGAVPPEYSNAGVGSWDDLPGTRKEADALAALIPGTTELVGADASEARLKAMSASGELAKYRRLHFATHGIVIPSNPDLAALVLSQGLPGPDDGYLRLAEVAKLKLHADFVDLSACETGLGKIYGGEGVVGLAQAFFVAGANAVSVSLWQVSDESTVQFMSALYKLTDQQHMTTVDAMAKVRQRFIAGEFGEKLKAPYYWAPFVYFGAY